jgi:transposase
MRAERAKLSRHAAIDKAIDYMLTRWEAFTRFLDDGGSASPTMRPNVCCAASRSAGNHGCSPDQSAGRSVMDTLIQTAKLNSVDPQAWLADVLARIADTPQTKLAELLPWNWQTEASPRQAA